MSAMRYICPFCRKDFTGFTGVLCSGSFLDRDHPGDVAPVLAEFEFEAVGTRDVRLKLVDGEEARLARVRVVPTFEVAGMYRQIGLVGERVLFSREPDGTVELEIEYPDRTDLDPNGTSDMYITINPKDWAAIVEYVKDAG